MTLQYLFIRQEEEHYSLYQGFFPERSQDPLDFSFREEVLGAYADLETAELFANYTAEDLDIPWVLETQTILTTLGVSSNEPQAFLELAKNIQPCQTCKATLKKMARKIHQEVVKMGLVVEINPIEGSLEPKSCFLELSKARSTARRKARGRSDLELVLLRGDGPLLESKKGVSESDSESDVTVVINQGE